MNNKCILLFLFLVSFSTTAQDYFTARYAPFNQQIQSPEAFLNRPIGAQHTRHDLIVAYLEYLASASSRAKIIYYGKTHEGRKLPILIVGTPNNIGTIEALQKQHLAQLQAPNSPDISRPLLLT